MNQRAKGSIAALLVTVALAGCSIWATQTTPVAAGEAVPVPAERLLLTAPANAEATITVVRDVGFRASGCLLALYVNRSLAARMATGEIAHFRVPAGEVVLGVGRDPTGQFPCGSQMDARFTERETTLKAAETKKFRMVVSIDGFDIMRSDF